MYIAEARNFYSIYRIRSSALTHFVSFGPSCLCEVSNVGISIGQWLIILDKVFEIFGGDLLARVEPEVNNLDNLLKAKLLLLLLLRDRLELDNILGKLKIKVRY